MRWNSSFNDCFAAASCPTDGKCARSGRLGARLPVRTSGFEGRAVLPEKVSSLAAGIRPRAITSRSAAGVRPGHVQEPLTNGHGFLAARRPGWDQGFTANTRTLAAKSFTS